MMEHRSRKRNGEVENTSRKSKKKRKLKQSKTRIWTACEILARQVIIELSEVACDLVERKEMMLTNDWL